MKILIAEDTPSARLLLERTLQREGYEVVATENGQEAYEALIADPELQVVVTDWMMPVVDGLDFCNRVREAELDRFIYLLMLTAVAEKKDLAAALEAGADDYVTKPFDKLELLARVKVGFRMVEMVRTIKRLKELLPICMYCKKIRNDGDYWQQVEEYLHAQTGTDFSHGICPECYETVVKPELEALRQSKAGAG